jgi:hypothetical protein
MDILNDIVDILIDRIVNSIHSRDKAEYYYDRLQVIINILDKINRKINTKFKLKKRSKRAKSNRPKVTLSMLRSYADTISINNDESLINNDGTSNSNDESSSLCSSANTSNSNDESMVNIDESPYYCHIL